VTLVLGIAQLGLAIHVRTTLVACAAEGARYAANADRGPDDGVARTQALIADALSPALAQDVTAGLVSVGGLPIVEVRVRAPLPLLGLAGPSRALEVRGRAVEEAV
jgi:hypothetical protein